MLPLWLVALCTSPTNVGARAEFPRHWELSPVHPTIPRKEKSLSHPLSSLQSAGAITSQLLSVLNLKMLLVEFQCPAHSRPPAGTVHVLVQRLEIIASQV